VAPDGFGQNVTVTGLEIVVAAALVVKGRTVGAAAGLEQTEAAELDQAAIAKSLAGRCLVGAA